MYANLNENVNKLKLLSRISLTFVNLDEFDIQMDNALSAVGSFLQVSRAYIFLDDENSNTTSNVYEWCNKDVEPQKENLQNVPYISIPSWKPMLTTDGIICAESITQLPSDIQKVLSQQGILSILAYPLVINRTIKGFIGFDECKYKRKWDKQELELLKGISGVMSNAYSRKKSGEKLKAAEVNFHTFFDTINDIIIVVDNKGDIIYSNSRAIEVLGYSMLELKNMRISMLHPPDKRAEAEKVLIKMFHKETDSSNIELMKRNGTVIPVDTRIWFGSWNNQECLFSISRDITREREALQKFTRLFENNPALMAISTIPERILQEVNSSFIHKLGYTREEVIGKTAADLHLFANIESQSEVARQLQECGKISNMELQVKCKDNSILFGLFSGEVIESQGKEYFLTVMVDITQQKALQKQIQLEKNKLVHVIEGTRLGTWEWNIGTGEIVLNERWADIIGYKLSELMPTTIETWAKLVHPEDLKRSNTQLTLHFEGKKDYYDIECRMKHKEGYWIWIQDRGKVFKWDVDGKPLLMFGTHTEITRKKIEEEKLKIEAQRDQLTGLYNRKQIYSLLDYSIANAKSSKQLFSLAMIDVDYFKKVNDEYGHLTGDYILKEFASFLALSFRKNDIIGRYGGEEFIVIMHDIGVKECSTKIEFILQNLRKTNFEFEGNTHYLTFSCGIIGYDEINEHSPSPEQIIDHADKRLYMAKKNGRNQVIFRG